MQQTGPLTRNCESCRSVDSILSDRLMDLSTVSHLQYFRSPPFHPIHPIHPFSPSIRLSVPSISPNNLTCPFPPLPIFVTPPAFHYKRNATRFPANLPMSPYFPAAALHNIQVPALEPTAPPIPAHTDITGGDH